MPVPVFLFILLLLAMPGLPLSGVLAHYYLMHFRPDYLGRVVILSPPNQGSEAADKLKEM